MMYLDEKLRNINQKLCVLVEEASNGQSHSKLVHTSFVKNALMIQLIVEIENVLYVVFDLEKQIHIKSYGTDKIITKHILFLLFKFFNKSL